jgi:MFS transporter, OFA family, oxalate/formate antiporter
MTDRKTGAAAIIGSSAAIFWQGAFIFGLPGVMAPHWQEMFHVGRGATGNILFFVIAATGFFMFFVGRWQEKLGIRWTISIGAAICGLNLITLVYASNVYLLYLWAFLMGLASCFVYVPALTSVQRWYPARRGLVSGIVNLIFGLSGAIMSPLFGWMLTTVGYAPMLEIMAVIALSIGLVAAQFTEAPSQAPAMGQEALGTAAGLVKPGRSMTVKESLRTKSFWFLWLTWAFQGAAGIAMVTLSTAFGLSKGFGFESAVVILTAFNVTNGLGRFLTGYLSDLVGRNFTMSMTFFAAGCAYLVLPHATSLELSALMAAVVGFGFGSLFGVSAPLVTDCFGMKHFGPIFGLVFTAYGFVSGIIGPSMSGYILDVTNGNFGLVFGYLGIFCLMAGVFIRFVVPPLAIIDEQSPK